MKTRIAKAALVATVLAALAGGTAPIAFANPIEILVEADDCGPRTYQLITEGSIRASIPDCEKNPGILFHGIHVSVETNHAKHMHNAIYASPSGGGYPSFTITSAPPWNADGYLLTSELHGFASFQGNPGDIFSWSARMEATYNGTIVSVFDSGMVTKSGEQMVIDKFAKFNCLFCDGGGDFVSTLTVTLSGPGELHLEETGIGEVVGIPEPATWLSTLVGFAVIGLKMGRYRSKLA